MTEGPRSAHQREMRLFACCAALVLAAACGDNDIPAPAAPAWPEVALVPATAGSDVDVLFVVENTGGDFAFSLRANFSELVNALRARRAGLPNLHIGVVTSDLGTSSTDDPPAPGLFNCAGSGDAGNLTGGTFLSDVAGPGGTRVTNYRGTIQDAFGSLAAISLDGCGFRQPIEAAVRALDDNPANAGFRRPNAALAIVMVGDSDDCSLAHGDLTTPGTSVLGPLSSFRCYRYGVTCELGGLTPDAMNTPGPKSWCHANEQSPYLASVREAARALEALPPDPRDLLVAEIVGDPAPVAVELRAPQVGAMPVPAIAQSCSFEDSSGAFVIANPAIRLVDFAHYFRRHTFASVCTQDFGPALDAIALQLGAMLGDPCVPVTVRDPSACTAADEPQGGAPIPLPACGGAAQTDCFTLAPDPAACPLGDHLALHVARSTAPPPGTMTSLRCAP